jgi:predicted transcriptional regulator of viral defense system
LKLSEYIETTQAFTTEALLSAVGNTPSVRVALSRAVANGKVSKVRKGLYVSKTGKFTNEKADPHLIIQAFKPDAVFVYHSALELHGLAHSLDNRTQFAFCGQPISFSYENIWFLGYSKRGAPDIQSLSSKAFGTVNVTTREQTLVDCLAKIGRSGGAEEVIRSLSALSYIDAQLIYEKSRHLPVAVISRIGWLLEKNQKRWDISDAQLALFAGMIPKQASSHLDPDVKDSSSYSAKWHLNLPAPETEVDLWLG